MWSFASLSSVSSLSRLIPLQIFLVSFFYYAALHPSFPSSISSSWPSSTSPSHFLSISLYYAVNSTTSLQIRMMCYEYISNPNAIILAVTAANQDLGASSINLMLLVSKSFFTWYSFTLLKRLVYLHESWYNQTRINAKHCRAPHKHATLMYYSEQWRSKNGPKCWPWGTEDNGSAYKGGHHGPGKRLSLSLSLSSLLGILSFIRSFASCIPFFLASFDSITRSLLHHLSTIIYQISFT